METRPASHPPADVLLALGAGKLDGATADAIFFHVEVCPDCLKTAGRLSGDSFLDKLRAARGYSGTPAPSKVLSSFPAGGYTAPIPTTSERPALTILSELRDHPQYEVLRELGRGGMGVVYLAKNKLMDRREVLKVVNKQLLGEASAAERFLREIRAAAQLNHPNIVTAYSALQVGDVLLFSMEYIEGRDLAQVVKARGPLPAAHAGSYVLQAARGLQHAFEKGMVHRDIKPQNLILDGKTNIVKILDFGLAKAASATKAAAEGLTGLNMMMGTPDYMAPEQARDAANVDIRADIYSLGCTLYCLIAGHAPFVGGSLATKVAAHQLSEPEPVESLRQDLPPGLAGIVRKMMAKDPEQRYQKPDDVVQALTICFKGKGKQSMAKGLPAKVVTAKPVAAPKLSTKGEGKSIYEKKTAAPIAAPRQTVKEGPSPVAQVKNEDTARRKKWLMGAGGAAAALMLMGLIGLWAAGVFKIKTPDGILVVDVNEPNAEVFVDGDRMTVSWDKGGTKAEIHVKPGTRNVEVKKDGFSVAGKELSFKDGAREVFTARLLPVGSRMGKAGASPIKGAAEDGLQPGNVWEGIVEQVADGGPKRLMPETLIILSREDKALSAHFDLENSPDRHIIRELHGTVDGGVVRFPGKDAKIIQGGYPGATTPDVDGTVSEHLLELRAKWSENGKSYSAVAKLSLAPSTADAPPSTPAADGYVTLFNGKDLAGWETRKFGPANRRDPWEVEDGVLKARFDVFSSWGALLTKRSDYQNFRFRVEMTVIDGDGWAGSMLYLWQEKAWYRANIGTATGRDVAETGVIQIGKMRVTPNLSVRFRSGESFTQEVVVEGKRIRVYINNILTTEHMLGDLPQPGRLGITLSGVSTMTIRRIEVKELPPK